MRFGPVALDEAEGAVLAHSLREGGVSLKKGTVLDAAAVARLREAGVAEVIAARADDGDLDEDAAATVLAGAVAGPGVRIDKAATGRANLFAEGPGVLVVEPSAIDAFNRVDEAITLATLPAWRAVTAGEMVGTVKIIPFFVPQGRVRQAAGAAPAGGLIRVAPYRPKRVGMVATVLGGTSEKMLAKTRRVLEERIEASGSTLVEEIRVGHDPAAVAGGLAALRDKGCDMFLVYGASAIVDRADVIPAGIEAAGGAVRHLGMPVDPGNLLLIGDLDGAPVVGAPGCARSPKENGFDWVLQRLMADLPVGPAEVTGMGVGGLLMEIVSRPQPREAPTEPDRPKVAAVVLAAGRSRRMGGPNKLLETVDGRPLARIAAEAALNSQASPVVVVTGHQSDLVAEALEGLAVEIVANPDYAEGLSTSLKAGIEALPEGADGAVICLADMPGIDAAAIDRLIDTFDPASGRLVVVPTAKGKRGNPVLWAKRFFPALAAVRGDVGARHLIGENADAVAEVEMETGAPLLDIDTPEALARLREAGSSRS